MTKKKGGFTNDIFNSKTWSKPMEYERYHLVSLKKEVVEVPVYNFLLFLFFKKKGKSRIMSKLN
jgi:hypothetical protein